MSGEACIMRWTALRKAALLEQIRRGQITRDRILAQHAISVEEFASWEARFATHGHPGLAVRKLQALPR